MRNGTSQSSRSLSMLKNLSNTLISKQEERKTVDRIFSRMPFLFFPIKNSALTKLVNTIGERLASQSPFRTRSSTADCAPAVPVTGTTSQHRFARCDSVASSRDDSTPRSDARFVSPLALTHVGYTVSPRGFRGLTASAFSLPWRSARDAI